MRPEQDDAEVILVAQTLVAHILVQDSAIRYEAGVCYAHVVINLEDLLVSTLQLIFCPVQRDQNYMGVALHKFTQSCPLKLVMIAQHKIGYDKGFDVDIDVLIFAASYSPSNDI